MTDDRLALYAVFGILFLRIIIEIKRSCAYGPKQTAVTQADARTRFSIPFVLSFRWGAKGVGTWTVERERAAFEKGGQPPRGKRLRIILVALIGICTILSSAAYKVAVATRTNVGRRDYKKLTQDFSQTLERKILVHIWTDMESEVLVANAIRNLENLTHASYRMITQRSSVCGDVREHWSDWLTKLSDEEVDNWIFEHACEEAQEGTNPVYDVFIISGGASASKFVIGKHRAAWMRCDQRGSVQQCSHLLEENLHHVFTSRKSTSRNAAPVLTTSDGVLLASFSLVNAEPIIGYSFTWDFQGEVEEPFLGQLPRALSRVLELRIEAQVIRHAPSRIRPKWSEDHQGYLLNAKNASFFIDSDWPIDTSVTYTPLDGKPLQFVVYIPPRSECPLYVLDPNDEVSTTNSFFVEGWGGVVIFNPAQCNVSKNLKEQHLHQHEILNVVRTFVQQLRMHLGVVDVVQKEGENYDLLPSEISGFATWEVDEMVHERLVSDAQLALSTLESVDQVITSITDIAVPEVIADEISISADALQQAFSQARDLRYDEASLSARRAHAAAEAAFFHPFSLGGLEAYPFEYKIAAIMPILLPTIIPLLFRLIREVRHFQVRRHCAGEALVREKSL